MLHGTTAITLRPSRRSHNQAFEIGLDFWTAWPLFLVSATQRGRQEKAEPVSATMTNLVVDIAPPPIQPDIAPVIAICAVPPVPALPSKWKPKRKKIPDR